ncbi:MAG: inositol monophosphatase [Alphaproteobacteria bacterium]|uniref:Inositol-1-monophosphatase n=1 Tax=Candidatus Nitrobium versatile TaxID=2884831 RepID=A0A953JC80_9BACT|nr:inositol monophosphatase [Candidatus Nitrobium versatile]
MTIPPSSDFLTIAVKAAQRAGDIILENMGKITKDDIGLKQAADFVTRVDREAEENIIAIIRKNFPDHLFLAEESLRETGAGQYRWIIDPLDGTTNFIHTYPVFSVSIALEHRGDIITGVIFDPLRKELFTAERGRGAFLNGRAIFISAVTDAKDSLVTTGFPFRRKEILDKYLLLFKNVLLTVSDLRRAGSAALDLASVASGRCEAFFEIGLSPWDMAAGSLLIKEAGGVVTDFGGGSDYLLTGNIVAGNPALHPLLLKEVQEVFEGQLAS